LTPLPTATKESGLSNKRQYISDWTKQHKDKRDNAKFTHSSHAALNIHVANDVRQTGIHTAEPPVPEPSAFESELAIEKLKIHKSPGVDHIPAEMIKAGGGTILYEIHKLIISI
jgi:hypothetical protein